MTDLTLADFDFDLPEELIALRPARPRPASRLLVAGPDELHDSHVRDLARWLRPGDLLVFNDTRVIPARLRAERRRDSPHGPGVAQIEVTLAAAHPDGTWSALAKPAKRLRAGDRLEFAEGLSAEVIGRDGAMAHIRFNLEGRDLDRALEAQGEIPLPPYIAGRRATDAQDREDYQTVFA